MIRGDNIAEWTTNKLTRFIQQLFQEELRKAAASYEEMVVSRKLTVLDEIQLSQAQGTVGAAGGASALPATPSGYMKILDGAGLVKVIPYYNVS